MKIVKFGSKRTEKLCCNQKYAQKELGIEVSKRLLAALNFIDSAQTLEDIAQNPTYRLHSLKGKREDQLAMDLGKRTGFRLIITAEPRIQLESQSLDFRSKCRTVKYIIVMEVTKHYE